MSNDDTPAQEPPTPAPPSRNRSRLLLAGGAVGIALVAGACGFALGHLTADDGGDRARFGRPGFQRDFPGGGPMRGPMGGPMGGPGQPSQPPQQPDDGATEGSTSTS